VPANFNETEVEITLRTGSNQKKIIKNIAKHQESTITGLTAEWHGYSGQPYSFYVECAIKYGVNTLPLGTAEFHGNPMSPGIFEKTHCCTLNSPFCQILLLTMKFIFSGVTLKVEVVEAVINNPILTI